MLTHAVALAIVALARYLYVVNAGGEVEKFDTVSGKKIVARTLPSVPDGPDAPDGCLAYQALYDSQRALFYTVVPEQYKFKPDGTKDYRVLAITVPGLRLARQISAVRNASDAPKLERVINGRPHFEPAHDPMVTQLDLSGYAPAQREIPNTIEEQSNGRVLLGLHEHADYELELAVAHTRGKSLVHLQTLAGTQVANAHLAPGGRYVVVEEPNRTGFVLVEARTGKQVKNVAVPPLEGSTFLALSPNGKAIYHKGDAYQFIDLGVPFSNVAVTGREQACLSYFFANR